MNDVICGFVDYEGVNFTFFLDGFLLTLVSADEFPAKLEKYKETSIPFLKGITSNYYNICFFDLTLYAGFSSRAMRTYISGYVVGNNNVLSTEIEHFSAIVFKGSIIDKFYNPIIKYNNITSTDDYETGASVRILKPHNETDYIVTLVPHLELKFGVNNPSIPVVSKPDLGELHSYLRLSTDEPWDHTSVLRLYRAISGFFAFFNFRQNIAFDEIDLFALSGENKYENVATLHVHTNSVCTNISSRNTIVHNDIEGRYQAMYQLFSSFSKYLLFLPQNDDDAQILDYSKYVQTCAVFEGLFDNVYRDINRKNNDEDFRIVREKILLAIQKIIGNSVGRQKEEALSYYTFFEHENNKTLRNKFKYALEENIEILKAVYPNRTFSKSYIGSVAHKFTVQRNGLDHGKLELLSAMDVTPYSIAVCLIYIMFLQSIEVENESIPKIIRKMFGNYR